MGFDLGALLRGGGAGMAGYTEGQNERKKREEEARRAALSEALMNAQFKNYESVAQDRLTDNARQQAAAARQARLDAAAAERQRVADQRAAAEETRRVAQEGRSAATAGIATTTAARATRDDSVSRASAWAEQLLNPGTRGLTAYTDYDDQTLTTDMQQRFPGISSTDAFQALRNARDVISERERDTAAETRRQEAETRRQQDANPNFIRDSSGRMVDISADTTGATQRTQPRLPGKPAISADQAADQWDALRAQGMSAEEATRQIEATYTVER